VFGKHRDVRYLEDGAAIANDASHTHRAAAVFDHNGEKRIGECNPRDLFAARGEACSYAEFAVFRYGRIAQDDFIFRHLEISLDGRRYRGAIRPHHCAHLPDARP
jgi:hypothetical protein